MLCSGAIREALAAIRIARTIAKNTVAEQTKSSKTLRTRRFIKVKGVLQFMHADASSSLIQFFLVNRPSPSSSESSPPFFGVVGRALLVGTGAAAVEADLARDASLTIFRSSGDLMLSIGATPSLFFGT